jgi:hypothetical protein
MRWPFRIQAVQVIVRNKGKAPGEVALTLPGGRDANVAGLAGQNGNHGGRGLRRIGLVGGWSGSGWDNLDIRRRPIAERRFLRRQGRTLNRA